MTGENFSVQANLMVNDSVWPAMKRAYEEASGDLVDRMIAALEKSNELAHAQHIEDALSVLKQAIALQPDLTELKFRSTEILFMAGQPQEALAAFRDAFLKEPVWAEIVPRLASVGLLPNDPTLLKFILDQHV
jgi:tetratricopeptide (TPR) repeat protein